MYGRNVKELFKIKIKKRLLTLVSNEEFIDFKEKNDSKKFSRHVLLNRLTYLSREIIMAGVDLEAAMGESLLTGSCPNDTSNALHQNTVPSVAANGWSWYRTRVPKNQVTYLTQVFLVYGIIAVSLSQLILQASNRELWLILLSTSVGYVLPSPRLKFLKPKISVTSAASATTTTITTSAPLPFPLSTANVVDR